MTSKENLLQIKDKLNIAGRTLLTLDGKIPDNAISKVRVGQKEYEFDVAYDMKNTIGIRAEDVMGDSVEFL